MKKLTAILVAAGLGICMLTGCDLLEDTEQAEQPEQVEQVEQPEEAEQNEQPEQAEPEVQEEQAEPEVQEEQAEQDEPEEQPEPAGQEAGSVLCYSGKDVNGNPVNTADIFAKNKITMVNMWASWCGPCAGEIPELGKLNEEFKGKGCEIVGFLIDGEDPDGLRDAKDILNDAGASYLNVICPDEVTDATGLEAIPTTYFVDSSGKILDDPIVGAYPEEYTKTLDRLLSDM